MNGNETPVLTAHRMSKWFGEIVAINNIELNIGPGVTGLLGPNGAGKSTFIKTALGLYTPSKGDLLLYGEPPRNNLEVLRRVGYCPETDRFPAQTTGYEMVYWHLRLWGMNRKTARTAAETACDRVRMSDRMDDSILTYSQGMRQRIKIAQAISTEPDLLFLDEPMSGLDPESREMMFVLIRELGANGKTVIVSSHILYEIERATHDIVLLHKGRVLAHGQIRQIRELIDEHPHAVTISCPDPHSLAELYAKDTATLDMSFLDGTVTIRTSDPNHFYAKLNALALAGDVSVTSLTCPDDNLQAVFDYLVS